MTQNLSFRLPVAVFRGLGRRDLLFRRRQRMLPFATLNYFLT